MSGSLPRVAWVTGSRRGIGAAIVSALRARGDTVFATDVSESNGVDACDVRSAAALDEHARHVVKTAGHLDILVNNAGVQLRTPFVELGEDDYHHVIDTNVRGPFMATMAVARVLIDLKRDGCVVNICSVNADRARPDTAFYCASKGSVRSMTRALAVALGPHGIRVNSVAPGTIATDLNRDRLSDADAVRANVNRIALGRLGNPSDVAPAVAFLTSDDAAYITGATIGVHGGWTLAE